MAFDEDFHFGLIRLHATQWLPFFTHQPANAVVYGPVVRDPSYLYHYLMSFPFRLIQLITTNTTAQVIYLRVINIGLFAWGIILVRSLLQRLGASRALSHTALLLFIMVPIVPFLAAHINYDNLFIPLTFLALLVTYDWIDDLRQGSVSFVRSSWLLSLMLLASIVKYAFLPIAVAIVGVIVWQLWVQRHLLKPATQGLVKSFTKLSVFAQVGLTILVLVSVGLFSERYVVNVIRYHNPTVSCDQVLSPGACVHYGPWGRDYFLAMTNPILTVKDIMKYPGEWLSGMWERSFFAISDTYDTRKPLPVPGIAVIILAVFGCLLVIKYYRQLFHGNIHRQTALIVTVSYILVLFSQNIEGYVKTGQPVAINGRYLLPLLPIMFGFVGFGFERLWRGRERAKTWAVVIVAVLFLQGGGVMTFIVKSDPDWDWPNETVVRINDVARQGLQSIIIGGRDTD